MDKVVKLEGGWESVPKSDPALWERVLQQVKKEPGPWAAWKAVVFLDSETKK